MNVVRNFAKIGLVLVTLTAGGLTVAAASSHNAPAACRCMKAND